jgi:hypothetical protein
MICNKFKMTRMTTITSKTCRKLPVFGMLGMNLGPKKPSSHKMNRITMMVHNMRVLLSKCPYHTRNVDLIGQLV